MTTPPVNEVLSTVERWLSDGESVDVADEEARAVGDFCEGTIEVFVELVRNTAEASGSGPTFGDLVDAIRDGQPAVLATRVGGRFTIRATHAHRPGRSPNPPKGPHR